MTLWKVIVMGLVLANAGYFLWSHGLASPEEIPSLAAPGGWTPALKLASEKPDAPQANGLDVVGATAAGGGFASLGRGLDAGNDTSTALLTNVKRCISVGPFRDVADAAHAASSLHGRGYDARQRVAEGEVWAGVWVYLPLPSSRAANEQLLAKLKAGGIEDALEMPGPNDTSVLSLGLYSESKRAQSRVAQTQALGLNPGIADRKRIGNVYWIDFDLKPTDGLLNPADLQGDAGHGARLEVKGCPAVVSAQK